jgi:septum formation protein
MTDPPVLVLASASPRRARLLSQVGFDVVADPAGVDESFDAGVPPRRVVVDLAHRKAAVTAERNAGRHVLAADTLVAVDDEILGKPVDGDDARRMLRLMSDRWHDVFTGVVLVCPDGSARERVSHTRVRLAALTDEEIDRYAAGAEPHDKAGAYGIQEAAGWFVVEIAGSASNVAGLPLEAVRELVLDAGLPLPALGG